MATGIGRQTAEKPRKGAGLARTVPVFSLYGEASSPQQDGFAHIEDIESRSARYDWEIGPHTHHGLFQLLLLGAGSAEVRLDEVTQRLHAPAVVTVPAGSVHAYRFAPGAQGLVLTAAETLLAQGGGPAREMAAQLRARPTMLDFTADPASFTRLRALLDQVAAEFRDRPAGSLIMLEWLVSAVLLLVARRLASAGQAAARHPDLALFDRFRALVEQHVTAHWPVGTYAAALGVTEGRLNRACRAVADRTAFEVTQERLALEARRKLIYIAAPVALLAYELGFEDPAYFWRFFKRATGLTPREFRARERRRMGGDAAEAAPGP